MGICLGNGHGWPWRFDPRSLRIAVSMETPPVEIDDCPVATASRSFSWSQVSEIGRNPGPI